MRCISGTFDDECLIQLEEKSTRAFGGAPVLFAMDGYPNRPYSSDKIAHSIAGVAGLRS